MLYKIILGSQSMPESVKKDAFFYALYRMFRRYIIIYGIIVLFYQEFSLTFTHIMILTTVESVVMLLFDIPLGILSDLWGAKKIVIIGMILIVAAIFLYMFFPVLAVFFIAEAILALGGAFTAGADTSLIYNKFKNSGAEEYFSGFQSRISAMSWIIAAFASVSMGFLYHFNIFAPFIVSAAFGAAALLCFCMICHEKSASNNISEDMGSDISVKRVSIFAAIIAQFKDSINAFASSRGLMVICMLSAIFMLGVSNAMYLSQPLFIGMYLDIRLLGVVAFGGRIMAAFGSSKSAKLQKKFGVNIMYALLTIVGISLLLMGSGNLVMAITMLIIIYLVNGVAGPLVITEINRHASNTNRATISSMVDFVSVSLMVIFDPAMGAIADTHGLKMAYVVMGAILIAATAIAYLAVLRRKV